MWGWVILLAIVAPWDSLHVEADCNVTTDEQQAALQDVYTSFRGERWRVSTGWGDTSLLCSPAPNLTLPSHCCWHGITCCQLSTCTSRRQDPSTCDCDVGFVTRISMPRNNLVGPYSERLFQPFACHLQHLRLSENNISGDLTSNISGYQRLQTFMMSGNEMRGSIPTGIQNVTTLQVLDVSQNYLSGPMPGDLCPPDSDSQLTDLLIAGNKLNGTLVLQDCRSLIAIIAANNFFTGKIPSLRDHPQLRLMTLDNNSFTEQETIDTPTISRILAIHLSKNRLSKTLEDYDEMGDQFWLLREIDLEGSDLDTTLPDDIFTVMTNLKTFSAANNRLRGPLPEMRIGGMERVKLRNNYIHGTIPESYVLVARDDVLVALENTLLSCCGREPDLQAALRISSEEQRRIRPDDLYQSVDYSAPRLPSYMQLSDFKLPVEARRSVAEESQKVGLRCPALQLKSDNSSEPNILSWRIDPDYYMFESCECASGYKLVNLTKPGRTITFGCEYVPEDEAFEEKYEWAIAVIVVVGFILLSTALLIAFLGRSKMEFRMERWRKRMMGGPRPGQQGSLVTTDVSGYTAMCAIDPKVATQTMDIHNKLINKARWANCGSIIDQAGDSYTLAFRDAFDAVAFAIQVQLLMDATEWPRISKPPKRMSLQGLRWPRISSDRKHAGRRGSEKGSMRTIPEDADKEPLPDSPNDPPTLNSQFSSKGSSSPRSSSPKHGAPMDQATSPQSSAVKQPPPPNSDRLSLRVCIVTGAVPLDVPVQACPLASLSKEVSDAAAGGQTLMDGPTFEFVKDQLDELSLVTEDGVWLYDPWHRKVAKRAKTVTSRINTPSKEDAEASPRTQASNVVILNMGKYHRVGSTFERQPTGGKRELKTVPTFSTSNAKDAAVVGVDGDAGKEKPSSLLLFQVIPARKLPQAVSWGGYLNLSPDWQPTLSSQAFFSAPGALQALQGPPDDLPIVTAVFAAVTSFHALEDSHPAEAAQVSAQITELVLRMLRQVDGGYLCRSFGGCKFMLTFARPEAAIRWCLGLQRAILHHPWPHLDFTPRGFEEANVLGHMVFRGPRMKMGLNEGKPDSIQADYLGRADYNGDVINQASRFTEGAAAGGMVSCDEQLARRVFHHWNKRAAQLDLLPLALVHDSYCVSSPADPESTLHGSMSNVQGGGGTQGSGMSRRGSDPIVSPKRGLAHERHPHAPTQNVLHHQHHLQQLQQQQALVPRVVPIGAGESQESLFQQGGLKDQVSAQNSGLPQDGLPGSVLPKHTTVHAFSLGTYMFKGPKSPRSMVGILQDELGPRLAAFLPLEPPPEGSKAERVTEPARHGTWIFSAYGVVVPELPVSVDADTSHHSKTQSNSVPIPPRPSHATRTSPSSPHHESWDNSTDLDAHTAFTHAQACAHTLESQPQQLQLQQPHTASTHSHLCDHDHDHTSGVTGMADADLPQVSVTPTRTAHSGRARARTPHAREAHSGVSPPSEAAAASVAGVRDADAVDGAHERGGAARTSSAATASAGSAREAGAAGAAHVGPASASVTHTSDATAASAPRVGDPVRSCGGEAASTAHGSDPAQPSAAHARGVEGAGAARASSADAVRGACASNAAHASSVVGVRAASVSDADAVSAARAGDAAHASAAHASNAVGACAACAHDANAVSAVHASDADAAVRGSDPLVRPSLLGMLPPVEDARFRAHSLPPL